MGRYLRLTLLFSGIGTYSADAQVKVFILAGQSNAVGFTGNADELQASLAEPFEDVLFWYDIGNRGVRPSNDTHVRPVEGTNAWVPLRPQKEFGGRVAFDKPGAGFTGESITTGHGAELTLGRELVGNLSDEIAILKFAWNGTPLASLSGQLDWSVSSEAEYFDWMVEETATALSHLETDLGKTGSVTGLFWVQGEADAYAGTAEQYEENLLALVDAVRDEWDENLPVVIAQMHEDVINWVHPVIPGIDEPYLSEIRAAQQNVAAMSPLVQTVDMDDISLTSDSVHFDSAGLQVMGQRFADAYLAMVPEIPPSDFNQNGVADAADYVVWRDGGSPDDTIAGYNLWRAHFGQSAGSGSTLPSAEPLSAVVPEPSTALIMLLGALAAGCRRVTKQRLDRIDASVNTQGVCT